MHIIEADYSNKLHGKCILALMKAYALDPMGGGSELNEYTQTHLISQLQQTRGVFTILAFHESTPIGLINCVEGFSTFNAKKLLNIHDVVVIKDYRGQGVVHEMFKKLNKIVESQDYCKLTLEVLEGNEVAKKVYEKEGFSGYELDPAMGKAMFWQKKLP